jgi:hypothetical protein
MMPPPVTGPASRAATPGLRFASLPVSAKVSKAAVNLSVPLICGKLHYTEIKHQRNLQVASSPTQNNLKTCWKNSLTWFHTCQWDERIRINSNNQEQIDTNESKRKCYSRHGSTGGHSTKA